MSEIRVRLKVKARRESVRPSEQCEHWEVDELGSAKARDQVTEIDEWQWKDLERH